MIKLPKLGTGERFAALERRLSSRKGKTRTGKSREVANTGALAAWIGRRKYGNKRFAQLSAIGRREAT